MSDPAIRAAREKAAEAIFDYKMPDGDEFGVVIHLSDYIDASVSIPDQIKQCRQMAAALADAAVAAFLQALPTLRGLPTPDGSVIGCSVMRIQAIAAAVEAEARDA